MRRAASRLRHGHLHGRNVTVPYLSAPAIEDRPADGPLRTFGLEIGRVAFVPPQPPGWSFLVWSRSGAVTVRTESRIADACGATGVWVPRGFQFGVESFGWCDLRIAYFAAGFAPDRPFGAFVASGVLREIVERAVVGGYLDPANDRDARLLAVAADEVAAFEAAPEAFVLPLPRDIRLRAALEGAVAVPDAMPSVAELAAVAGMRLRTFERRFTRETGLTPRAWLQRARLRAATLALACGASITEAGLAGGYASLSAFIAAYRGVTGVTPGRRAVLMATARRV